jgi:cytochrome c oxidase subunit 2
VSCHGKAGEGVAATKAPAIAGLEAWYIERQLQHFATGVRGAAAGDTEGATMRAAAGVLKNDAERAAVAAYVAGLPRPHSTRRPPASAASATNGRNYFNALCSACHGANGQGNQSLGAPRVAGASPDYLARQFAAFKSGKRGAHPEDKLGGQMRQIAGMLPNAATEQDVIAYATALPP